MIDFMPSTAPVQSAQAVPVKAAGPPHASGGETPGFAEILAQSTERDVEKVESVKGEQSRTTEENPAGSEARPDSTLPDAIVGADLAAQLALMAMETRTCPPLASSTSEHEGGSDQPAPVAFGKPADNVRVGSLTHAAARISRRAESGTAAPMAALLDDQAAVAAGPGASTPAATTEQKISGNQINDGNGREKAFDLPAVANNDVRATQHVPPVQVADGPTKTTELARQDIAQRLETLPAAGTNGSMTARWTDMNVSTGSMPASLVPTHVESPAWSRDFGQHVIRLAVDGQPAAEIHLNPPDWGPIRVTIELKGDQATLQFSAEHAQTREALESSMPRLREIFSAGGVDLLDASVASQSFFQHPSGSQERAFDQSKAAKGSGQSLTIADAEPAALLPSRPLPGTSRVDLFA